MRMEYIGLNKNKFNGPFIQSGRNLSKYFRGEIFMKKGDKVIYRNTPYVILFDYENGYVEIKSVKNPYDIKLVELTTLRLPA